MQLPPTSIIFLVALHIAGSAGEQVTLHEHADFRGEFTTITLSGNECFNLPENWHDRASSIDTKNNCVIAWSYSGCYSGSSERIAPGTRSHSNLGGVDFNDKIRSLKLCSGPAEASGARWVGVQAHNSRRQSHQSSSINGDNENLHQAAQRHAEYLASNNLLGRRSGNQNLADVEGSREEEAVRNAVTSWYKEERHYDYGNPGFQTDSQHYTSLVWKATSQVGIGVAWNPSKKLFVVVANYDPEGNISGQFEENVKPQPRFATFPVSFYEHHNYEGEELRMEVIGGCHNLPDGWENSATSVKLSYECIVLWNQRACKGNSLKIKDDIKNLGDLQFNDAIASFNLCTTINNSD
ncbi:unnamed protein product [Orchesella dallaii]|uniref:SCP domain-containing protein n=1 Tax=Orchesella dallaii TaxID=48710 RepID=A0ABP1RLM8_9HEXA